MLSMPSPEWRKQRILWCGDPGYFPDWGEWEKGCLKVRAVQGYQRPHVELECIGPLQMYRVLGLVDTGVECIQFMAIFTGIKDTGQL